MADETITEAQAVFDLAKKDTTLSVVNPRTGEELIEYRGPKIEAYGFLEALERQVRNLKGMLRSEFEMAAQAEMERGFVMSKTFFISGDRGDVKVSFSKEVKISKERAARYFSVDPIKAFTVLSASYKLNKRDAEKLMRTIGEDVSLRELIAEDIENTPERATVTFVPKGGKDDE